MSSPVLIIGASSAMAEHCARAFAEEGRSLLLAGRDSTKLESIASDLRLRGAARVQVLPPFDGADAESIPPMLETALKEQPRDVLIAHGILPDNEACEQDSEAFLRSLDINFRSVLQICQILQHQLPAGGCLAVISSVAGLRGRQSNYVYGAAKGGLLTYLQGLRNRLQPQGIRVLSLLPGFVDTPMTADITKGPLFISAEKAGSLIHRAMKGTRDVVYIPFFWRYILWVIRCIPEALFKRLSL